MTWTFGTTSPHLPLLFGGAGCVLEGLGFGPTSPNPSFFLLFCFCVFLSVVSAIPNTFAHWITVFLSYFQYLPLSVSTPFSLSLCLSDSLYLSIYPFLYLSISISIHICCGVIIWAKFGLLRCYYLGQVCFLQNTVCQKHYKIRGFSTFVLEKNCARKFEVLLSGPSWSFLRCSQLGPNNNTYLAQIITPQNAFFFVFFCF